MILPVNYNDTPFPERRLVREEYIKQQKGLCHHCKNPLSGPASDLIELIFIDKDLFPENFFKWPVHLHHCHKTGMTIGAVHAKCNAYLWQYKGE
jgi:hypothetical protein